MMKAFNIPLENVYGIDTKEDFDITNPEWGKNIEFKYSLIDGNNNQPRRRFNKRNKFYGPTK